MNYNILEKFDRSNYFSHPFPHFIIHDALDYKEYLELEKEYEKIDLYFSSKKEYKKNNIRLQFNQNDLKNLNVDLPNWSKFMDFHSSEVFFKKLFEIFLNDLKIKYPSLVDEILINPKQFTHYCQPGINTPVKSKTTVRIPHLDKYDTLFTGLFYLKPEEDKTSGGDLVIYESIKKNYFYSKLEVSNLNSVIVNKKLKYDKNVFICFLNSEKAIHSVTERNVTNKTRRLVNFITKVPPQLSPIFTTTRDKNYLRILRNKLRDLIILAK
jgi:hypothetical protein